MKSAILRYGTKAVLAAIVVLLLPFEFPTLTSFFLVKKMVSPNQRTHGASHSDDASAYAKSSGLQRRAFANRQYDHFPTLDSLYNWIDRLQMQYPKLLAVEQIGASTSMGLPLYALKISDNAAVEEDESAVLFSAIHHAREPIGGVLCMRLVENLLRDYRSNAATQRLVDELELWVVPIVNPEGYKYVFDHKLGFPWWRKNLRDNDHDGIFNPTIDGVDLNRNYDYNWQQGGEDNPASWFFRGTKPFSENEIEAMQTLALRENIFAGLSFHSYGEVVLYPWGNYYTAPDQDLIYEVGQKLASCMRKLSGRSTYALLPLNGRVGQSSVWMYGRLRAVDFIVELGDEYYTGERDTRRVVEEGLAGIDYFLNRALVANIRGHVIDGQTGAPLVARIRIKNHESRYVAPRFSEPLFGRFERLLLPGVYTLEVSADGYATQMFPAVQVHADEATELQIKKKKKREVLPAGNH